MPAGAHAFCPVGSRGAWGREMYRARVLQRCAAGLGLLQQRLHSQARRGDDEVPQFR